MMNKLQLKTRDARSVMNCFVFFAVLLASALTAAAQSPANQFASQAGDGQPLAHTAGDAAAAIAAARRADALVTILAPARRDRAARLPVQVIVALGRRADASTFRARLNRQDITAHFTRQGNAMIAAVTAQHGLVPGDNRLLVEVRGPRGAEAADARRFTVAVQRPAADAGADRKHRVGDTVRLDGTGSQHLAQPGAGLTHRWVLASRPVGSQAVLNDPSSPTPQFVADEAGTYVAQLIVNDGFQDSAPDLVRVSAHENLPLIPLEGTQMQTGGQCAAFYAIKVNGTLYPGSSTACGDGAINVVTFTRSSFDFVEHFTADTSTQQGMNQLSAFLDRIIDRSQTPGDLIVVMATAGLVGNVSQIASQLEQLGATTEFRNAGNAAFSFVGARGLRKGEGYQAGGGANFAGYFVQDSQKNYTFMKFDYVPYLVKSAATWQDATIQVGGQTYTSDRQPDSSQLGGFHVVVVDRASLEVRSNKTYFTSNNQNGPGDRQAMYDDLSTLWGDETALVFVNSFGSPFAYQEQYSRLVARRLHMLGGTYDLIQGLGPTHTYALVGAGSVPTDTYPELSLYQGPEASTWLLNSTVLRGALGRGRRGDWYSPVMAGNDEALDPGLYTIVGQAPQSWSFPGNADEQAAYNWISSQICSTCTGDLRAYYSDFDVSIDTLHANLAGLNYPGNSSVSFSGAAFSNVQKKWLQEMTDVINIRLFQTNLTQLWTAQQSNISLLLTSIEQEVKDAVKPNPESFADQIFENVIGGLIEGVEGAAPEITQIPIGVFQGLLDFAMQLAKTPEGPSATEQVESKVADLAKDAVDGFEQQLAGMGSLFEVIYQDPGKIQALGQKLTSNDAQWAWGGTTTSQLLDAFENSLRISYYQSLLATLAVVENMVADYNETPADWCSMNPLGSCDRPYGHVPPEGYYLSLSWGESENRFHDTGPHSIIPLFWVEKGYRIDPKLLQYLYTPVSQGGLGVPKPYFLRRWPFVHRYCDEEYTNGGGCGLEQWIWAEQLGPSGMGRP